MTENRITDNGVFGPVFAHGVCPADGRVYVTEGLVEFHLLRHDAVLTIEMTVDAADRLADMLTNAVTTEIMGKP